MKTVNKIINARNLFFALTAVFLLVVMQDNSRSAVAAEIVSSKAGSAKIEKKAPVPETEGAIEDEGIPAPEISEWVGTVDAVRKESFVIDDSSINLPESVHFFDKYGKRTSSDAFKEGDKVRLTWSEDIKGVQTLVSLSMVQTKQQVKEAVKKTTPVEGQKVKKVNGVWVN